MTSRFVYGSLQSATEISRKLFQHISKHIHQPRWLLLAATGRDVAFPYGINLRTFSTNIPYTLLVIAPLNHVHVGMCYFQRFNSCFLVYLKAMYRLEVYVKSVFWDATFRLADCYRLFGETCCLYFQGTPILLIYVS
jgi:hypothetical protein